MYAGLLPTSQQVPCSNFSESSPILIGDGIRAIREEKKLSQRDIEKRTGLLRSYISRVENGHTTRSVETLKKWAPRA